MAHVSKRDRVPGFTLVEIAIVIAIIAVLGALLAPLAANLSDAQRAIRSYGDLGVVYKAIVGEPGTSNFGYLGDVGTYPATLADLVRDRGLEGWSGPYVTDTYLEGDTVFDSFGNPMEYYYRSDPAAVTDQLALISKAPDRGSSNTSATPNDWMTFVSSPLPGSAAYVSNPDNLDNVTYPRFTDHSGMLSYNNIGQLNLSILAYDANPGVARYVPACPNMFDVKVTSLARPTDTWGTAAADTTPVYSPGGATFDLIQGAYRMQVRLNTTPNGVAWDETISIAAGGAQTRTINLPGPNSSATPSYYLSVMNRSGVAITVYNAAGTSIGTAVNNAATLPMLVRGCSQVSVRATVAQTMLDSFTMPIGLTSYTRTIDPISYTYTVTNNSGAYRYLFVYLNNLLIGEVSGWGNKKVKAFGGLKLGDNLIIKDRTGNSRDGVVTIFGNDSTTF